MPSVDQMIRSEVRKLARQGRLVDHAFKTFQRQVFTGAAPEQVHTMRTCFFAGAAEFWAIVQAAADEGEGVSDDEEAFMVGLVGEIERFHLRTIVASTIATEAPQ